VISLGGGISTFKVGIKMKKRLDVWMTEREMVRSRAQARDLIKRGKVSVDDVVATKAGVMVEEAQTIKVSEDTDVVGRGALKLAPALDAFNLDVAGKVAADVGASTGGFTQVMLQREIAKVYAIDVGHDQLVKVLRDDPRVVDMEGTNIRGMAPLPELLDCAVVDLSFISLKLVFEDIFKLMKPEGWVLVLVKPQFEAGRGGTDRQGVVRDPSQQQKLVRGVIAAAADLGWSANREQLSEIQGKHGNREMWVLFERYK
jgi:23S rRNA (cytidine1920-2'-O)/16S rRNA (cytidine1409-2'-O)-methyltransferase